MRSVPQSEVADRPFLWTRGVAASEESVYAAVQSPNLSAENREASDQREPGSDDE
jgi:hypothetical protein